MNEKLKGELTARMVEIIHRHTVSDKFKDEEVGSNRDIQPPTGVRPVEAQVDRAAQDVSRPGWMPGEARRKPLPAGAEGWFAIPRWESLASSYSEAVEMMAAAMGTRRKFSNRIAGRLNEKYLRQSERSRLAEKILAEQQEGQGILVVAAQVGCCIGDRRRDAHGR